MPKPLSSSPPKPPKHRGFFRRWTRRILAALIVFVLILAAILVLSVRRLPLDPDYAGPDRGISVPALPQGPHHCVDTFREKRLNASKGWGYIREHWAFTSASAPPDAKPQEVEWYRPARRTSPGPAVILLPILAGDYPAERIFARHLARSGFSVVIARRFHGLGNYRKVQGLNHRVGTVLEKQRRVLDWMVRRPEIDPARIGCLGLSMGALKGALLSGTDSRIQATVLGLAGGDLPFILAQSRDFEVARRRRRLLECTGWSADEYEKRLRAEITWDPLRTAPRIDARTTLLILARFDVTIPISTGFRLREAMGNPETLLVPTGHYSSMVFMPYTLREVTRFFRQHLGNG